MTDDESKSRLKRLQLERCVLYLNRYQYEILGILAFSKPLNVKSDDETVQAILVFKSIFWVEELTVGLPSEKLQ